MKKYLTIFFCGLLIIQHSSLVLAQSTEQEKCNQIKMSIDKKNDQVLKTVGQRVNRYHKLSIKLTALSERLKKQGEDTSSLEKAIKNIYPKAVVLVRDMDLFQNELKQARSLNCDQLTSAQTFEKAKIMLEIVYEDEGKIRNYLINTVRPLLKSIETRS